MLYSNILLYCDTNKTYTKMQQNKCEQMKTKRTTMYTKIEFIDAIDGCDIDVLMCVVCTVSKNKILKNQLV